ncbi:hypothetical protein D9615_004883 [Tricholomella constricta]|uniref:Uncharacterized protein n=1 Tax=Tricholomella constricta TaxID=117010 RepID=A0A8H5HGJ4_9AGAR|nr:hypothetical protein D9615_004883 [Tricholomella constricta]
MGVYIITRKNFYLAVIFILQILAQLGLGLYIMSIPWRIVALTIDSLKLDIVYLSLTLAFDSLVLIVTLTVTITAAQQSPTKHWLKVIQNDGILYFMAIFSSTLIWLMFGVAARDGLKFINAM